MHRKYFATIDGEEKRLADSHQTEEAMQRAKCVIPSHQDWLSALSAETYTDLKMEVRIELRGMTERFQIQAQSSKGHGPL
jgi:hypothetical protein